ncbi:MAG: MFS transporter [Planctomycetota bacterium]|nr:MFS transporter [Planctomycetota bacterium]
MPPAAVTAPPTRRSFSASTAAAVGIAAAAMVATLPGRTHGLGLVTEPLLADLGLERVSFAALNFWATLVGSAFCLPVGWVIDRLGVRVVLAAVLFSLGLVVVGMTGVTTGSYGFRLPTPEVFFIGGVESAAVPLDLFLLVLLSRGLGQSALSVVSLALVGKAAGDRPGVVIGVYSFLVAVGFMASFAVVKAAFEQLHADWRTVWVGIGWVLIGFGVLAFLFVREWEPATAGPVNADSVKTHSLTLGVALRTPGFWVFGLATSFYGMVAAGMSLFNQSLLAERGFDRGVFLTITTVTPLIGLAANLLAGWLATRIRLGVLLAAGLLIQTVALAVFPSVSSLPQVYAYAAAMGVAGGVLTVVFFTVWRQAFGPAHLGQIQGAAQLLTVLASAAGPLVLAAGQRASGSYAPVVQNLALVGAAFALAALIVPLPTTDSARKEDPA